MTVGDAIFMSAVLLSIVGLYAATKDRWRWRRIVKWAIGAPVALLLVVAVGVWAWNSYDGRLRPVDEFQSIKLGASRADVRFLKGEPSPQHSDADMWVYDARSGSAEVDDAVVIVMFRGDRLKHVAYWANERQIVRPYLHGFTIGSDYDAVVAAMGTPAYVSVSADGLNRLLSFDKYSTFYEFQQAKVRSMGIYDVKTGPMKFKNEAGGASSSPPASSASR